MPNPKMISVGYQLRKVNVSSFCGTIADNINPLYLPLQESRKAAYESILARLHLPFLVRDKEDLIRLCRLTLEDDSQTENTVRVFRCALLEQDTLTSSCEFYDSFGKIKTSSFILPDKVMDEFSFKSLGYDVLDASHGGGFDSAIHTYGVRLDALNKCKLLDDFELASETRTKANQEIEGHGPFTIWEIGLLPSLLEIVNS